MQSSAAAQTPAAAHSFERDLTALIPHMRAFARSLCGNPTDADDLAQDALAKAWQARGSFTPGTNLKAWTFMIVRNQFYSDKRRSWRSSQLDPEVAAQTLVAVDDPSAALELDELRRALLMLPEEQREALTLIGAAGLSYEEASAVTGVNIGTVKSRVSRARDRIALILAEGHVAADGQSAQGAMAAIFAQVDALRGRRLAA
jgi:RNA polymerase sigma-70 factor (ECF subfamily)